MWQHLGSLRLPVPLQLRDRLLLNSRQLMLRLTVEQLVPAVELALVVAEYAAVVLVLMKHRTTAECKYVHYNYLTVTKTFVFDRVQSNIQG